MVVYPNNANNVEETTMDIRTERATQPIELTDAELDHVFGGGLTTEKETKSGHDTSGQGGGLVDVVENPNDKKPPGHNK